MNSGTNHFTKYSLVYRKNPAINYPEYITPRFQRMELLPVSGRVRVRVRVRLGTGLGL